jgi:hypothetical protein
MNIHENSTLGALGSAIGKGLIAGIAATAAITISQMIEMKITKRKPSEAPVKVASRAAGVKPADKEQKEKVSHEIHWAYGTIWGVARGLVALTGLKGALATAAHFVAVWGTSMILLPKFKAAPPVTEEDARTIAVDGFHHALYATTAGFVYDALDAGGKSERGLNSLLKKLHLN